MTYTVTCTAVEAELFTTSWGGHDRHNITARYRFQGAGGVELTLTDTADRWHVGDTITITLGEAEETA